MIIRREARSSSSAPSFVYFFETLNLFTDHVRSSYSWQENFMRATWESVFNLRPCFLLSKLNELYYSAKLIYVYENPNGLFVELQLSSIHTQHSKYV